jgi:predicted RNA-binding protein with PUA-like domain
MAFWLFKEEPDHYNLTDLKRDGRTVWDGVTNSLALKHLRRVRPGDRVLYYHTGKEKAVVGEMRVVSEPREDNTDGKSVVVEVEFVSILDHPVSLTRIKQDPTLTDWELVRLPRLSVVPVTENQWLRIEAMSRPEAEAELGRKPKIT